MTEEVVEKDVQESKEVQEHQTTESSPQSDKEFNFAQIRKQLQERDEHLKERDQYIKSLKEQMDELKHEVMSTKRPKEEEPEISDDDFLTKKQALHFAEQIADKKYSERMAQYEQQNFKTRAQQTYKDFDEVVTPENLQRLESEMPEIASLIAESRDNYKMACGAYKAIKKLQRESDPKKEIEANKAALENNKKEPLAAAAVDRRPIAQATRLSDKDYQKLWEEMQYYASKS